MSIEAVKREDYFQVGEDGLVVDSRFISGAIEVPDNQTPFEFDGDQLTLPGVDGRASPYRNAYPQRTKSKDYINGLTILGSVGSDGEVSSGCIELVQVDVPRSLARLAVIRSFQTSHDALLPVGGCNWVCEFDDIDRAKAFWTDYRHYFPLSKLRENLEDAELESSTVVYETGLLKPWFMQSVNDVLMTDRFSSYGTKLTGPRDGHKPNDDFVIGGVYKIPELDHDGYNVKGFRVATCLASIGHIAPINYLSRQREDRAETFLQWSDGSFLNISNSDKRQVPERLKAVELASS